MQQANNPQTTWKSQEEQTMHITLTPSHLAELSRSREQLNRLVFWATTATLAACAGSAFYHVVAYDQPWLRIGQILALAAFVYLMAPTLERGSSRRGADEPSGRFLLREHEERRQSYLWIRNRLFVCIPSIIASWWGVMQVRPAGSWLVLLTGFGLVIAWFAFGKGAEKAARDAEEVRRGMET